MYNVGQKEVGLEVFLPAPFKVGNVNLNDGLENYKKDMFDNFGLFCLLNVSPHALFDLLILKTIV